MNGYTERTWARCGPIAGLPGDASTLLIDASEAAAGGLDLEAEGFAQIFSGLRVEPHAELYLVIPTPYDLEVVRQRDFDPARFQLPAIMAGTFSQPHSQVWLESIARDLLVLVVPGLTDLPDLLGSGVATELALPQEQLRAAWCAFARIVTPVQPA
ncbi:hypothetical protein ACFV9C_41675 [Kribbella sp. NPDC059898]|uniref:hypothetical protein n=1 Tax=Kribbella sp. NPDC059898 TaxID=3346995 RepID=UPI00364E679F